MAPLRSVGAALTDALDDLIMETRIDPQLAMKILANFDRAIAEVLQNQVKARLTFKVLSPAATPSSPSHPAIALSMHGLLYLADT